VRKKTVFILGAGFSCEAEIPLQSQLLNEILRYTPADFEEANIYEAQNFLRTFIKDLFSSRKGIALEDIFTILDRCVIAKERFKNYTWKQLYDCRNHLITLILHILNVKQNSLPVGIEDTYNKFSRLVITKRRRAGQSRDPIAIISSNWDTVAESFINKMFTKRERSSTWIDYCTFTHGKGISHINLKAKGFYNIKILKLHGSLNWLHCSNCGRLFVDVENIGIQKLECEYCNRSVPGGSSELILEPLIITPTLLKELNNLHIKSIWQNAFIELQEATDIYFIGYSLPYADFEFKYILKKAIRDDANMNVILINRDKRNGTMKRYKEFFGKRINFNVAGFSGWMKEIEKF
jgi:NAD-dependent SIR2 family protein deacetylase